MSSLLWEVQRAAVARWRAWPALAEVGDRFYDFGAPQDSALPYVIVGDSTKGPVGVLGGAGGRVGLPAKVVTDDTTHDHGPALTISQSMTDALVEPLSIQGYVAARLKLESETKLVEKDGDRTYRLVPVRYTLVTMEA